MTVLCITGWCRNGSTIIGNILNEIPGVIHVGELHFLWKNAAGRGANSSCGCGLPLMECPFWSPIASLALPEGTSPGDFATEVVRRQRACVRTRHTWRVLRHGIDRVDLAEHAELMSRIYQAIAERSGAGIIVDTSKIPGEAALLDDMPGVRPYFVHLVRDPRAVAESWRQPKQYVYAMSAARSTAYWHGFNLASAAIVRRHRDRSLFVRYEDFIADPAATIDRLLRLCGASQAANPVRDRVVDLHPNHTVTGNPDRFLTGPTVLRAADDRWVAGLGWRARLAATVLGWPLFTRYGYRARAARPADATTCAEGASVGHRT